VAQKRDAMHRIDLWRQERNQLLSEKRNYIKLLKAVKKAVVDRESKSETFTAVLDQIQSKLDQLHKMELEKV
jgi:uncharacterized protein YyaL (SSP411 family)